MKKTLYRLTAAFFAIVVSFAAVLALAGCGSSKTTDSSNSSKTDKKAVEAVAGDYYLDLSELGMKLVIYLRLTENGTFQFSNTTDFEINKSSGVVQKGANDYVMVYESVNGADKSISDGLTSSFFVDDEGRLDFTHCEKIYYGSASATTTSDSSDAKLLAVKIPEGYEQPDTESAFTTGTYTATGADRTYTATFYVDNTYVVTESRTENGEKQYFSETGTYGVNTSQLALTPEGKERISCEVLSDLELQIQVLTGVDTDSRETLTFKKQEVKEVTAKLTGTGTVTRTNESFDVTVLLYSDGSYTSRAGSFTENGVIVPDSKDGTFKIYPDNNETKLRGLNQIATVPAGTLSSESGGLKLEGFRVRNSDNLTRYKCEISEN
ncbi:hypothetical protein [Lachnospira intestinalis]|uniref:Uncharacterized protein n=1 Tax=Lachnospira intestinalis TaxID=3133158 RepID=A0ABV1HAI8_9FIRM